MTDITVKAENNENPAAVAVAVKKPVTKKVATKTATKKTATKKVAAKKVAAKKVAAKVSKKPTVKKEAVTMKKVVDEAQKEIPNAGIVAGKEVVESAAVLPIVSSKTKEVFLKVIPKRAIQVGEQITQSIQDKKFTGLGAELKAFAKEHPDVKVWHSKAAKVRAGHLEKSQTTQLEFWQRSGFTVVNLAEMVASMKEIATKAVESKQKEVAKDTKPAANRMRRASDQVATA